MARAVVESIGYAIRDVIEVMEEDGYQFAEMRIAGFQSRNETLNQIKADITGKRVLVPSVSDSELMGCACVGLGFLGKFSGPVEASEACVKITREIQPAPEVRELYSDRFSLYRELYGRLKDIYPRLEQD